MTMDDLHEDCLAELDEVLDDPYVSGSDCAGLICKSFIKKHATCKKCNSNP